MIKLKIKDIEWKIYLQNEFEYVSMHKDDASSYGLCDGEGKKIWFVHPVDLNTIKHELFHAYIASCMIGSTNNIGSDDMEEIACEVVAYHLEDILRHAKFLEKELKKEIKGLSKVKENKATDPFKKLRR